MCFPGWLSGGVERMWSPPILTIGAVRVSRSVGRSVRLPTRHQASATLPNTCITDSHTFVTSRHNCTKKSRALPRIPMAAKWQDADVYQLIQEISKKENFKVLYGTNAGEVWM